MNRSLLLLAALALGATASARQLSPAESLARFRAEAPAARRAQGAAAEQYALAYTSTTSAGPALYVFNSPASQGFVVLSADDAAPALLGYTDSGTFSTDALPDGLRYWMDCMSADVAAAAAADGVQSRTDAAVAAPHRVPRQAVAPLSDVLWAQDSPYCDDCPGFYDESYGRNRRAQAGCVAVAMAQVMYRYKWPKQGTGSHSYTNIIDGKTYSVDFSRATYNWDRLAFTYGSYSPDGNKYVSGGSTDIYEELEVAKLMYHCGVAVDMQYDHPKLGSGTDMEKAVGALRDYFGYDPGVHINKRFDCGDGTAWADADWEDLVYAELAAGRPVIYGGQVPGGGAHAFVVDGCSSAGLFHINWGWEGIDNGYFALSGSNPLRPTTQPSGYTFYQRCITGIKPLGSEPVDPDPEPVDPTPGPDPEPEVDVVEVVFSISPATQPALFFTTTEVADHELTTYSLAAAPEYFRIAATDGGFSLQSVKTGKYVGHNIVNTWDFSDDLTAWTIADFELPAVADAASLLPLTTTLYATTGKGFGCDDYAAGKGVFTDKPAVQWVITPHAYSGDAVGLLTHMVQRALATKCSLGDVRAVEASVLRKK